MNSPRRRALLALVLALVLPLVLPAPPALAAPLTLEGAMAALAAEPGGTASFTEEKAIPQLDIPLPSSGTLSWTPPDRLEKHTTFPEEEILRADGDRLLFAQPGRGIRRELSLDQSPEIRPLVESVRATLAGDLPVLRRYFEIDFRPEGEAGRWRMVLTPLSARLRVAVQGIEITGQGGGLRHVVTRASEGVTRLAITPRP
ncbi:outer membrane lipoprotein carrier protein LolA [Roseomonas sp. KE0001]|uniref:outer membrane lipoprotein carrier protein LolA n=1 Tax=Roseomonas sp. KE0001 TaxID=2479201 RepID=UPI0018DF03C5|nr:outer membrane lipoprotein carrier protein LolA [Roseomonas sp. KE0001]MBI0434939.1 outer membrane lipoprotein carrier protein LolA [Roseomonas sp. KE0001]